MMSCKSQIGLQVCQWITVFMASSSPMGATIPGQVVLGWMKSWGTMSLEVGQRMAFFYGSVSVPLEAVT